MPERDEDERDDLLDDDVEEQDRDDEDQDDADKDEWKPPSEMEWRKVQRALKRANKEAENLRRNTETVDEAEKEETEKKIRDTAVKESEARWKPIVVRQAARAALAEAGLVKNPNRLLKLLDMDDIDVSEDGDIDGLDEQIRDFKKEYPEFFGRRTPRDVDGGDKGSRVSKNKGSADVIARALTGGR
ncbi:phage scaffolding protein [Streptomyces griseoaurantiacus]|uniref:Phage scaffolding protein n=1 Tax=Streptomyces griseoaurantiacus TaxID=68213 RepID=A0A7W2DSJ0_9ACTN|nr:phage scaffolding protein [Streptomyces griseoaurantiacus]MBA5222230.1 phage scaffolding protein [Streptomyces griseoaurantiacus]